MSFALAPGVICYSWIPYSSDQTNKILGSIVQVKLIEPFSLGWSAEIRESGKPTAATKRGAKVYLVPTELFESANEAARACSDRYKKYLNAQLKALFKAGV